MMTHREQLDMKTLRHYAHSIMDRYNQLTDLNIKAMVVTCNAIEHTVLLSDYASIVVSPSIHSMHWYADEVEAWIVSCIEDMDTSRSLHSIYNEEYMLTVQVVTNEDEEYMYIVF
jgi:menaquinone-dependent protoporphyrinogen IX oxidase